VGGREPGVRSVPNRSGDLIFGLINDTRGQLWVTTNTGIYRVDPEAVLRTAPPNSLSTTEWRRRYQERVAQAPLALRVRQLMADGKGTEALALVNEQLAALGRVSADSPADQRLDWSVVQCLRAEVLGAKTETRMQAANIYNQLIMTKWADAAARHTAALKSMTLFSPAPHGP
jgi:hypothetical protein